MRKLLWTSTSGVLVTNHSVDEVEVEVVKNCIELARHPTHIAHTMPTGPPRSAAEPLTRDIRTRSTERENSSTEDEINLDSSVDTQNLSSPNMPDIEANHEFVHPKENNASTARTPLNLNRSNMKNVSRDQAYSDMADDRVSSSVDVEKARGKDDDVSQFSTTASTPATDDRKITRTSEIPDEQTIGNVSVAFESDHEDKMRTRKVDGEVKNKSTEVGPEMEPRHNSTTEQTLSMPSSGAWDDFSMDSSGQKREFIVGRSSGWEPEGHPLRSTSIQP